MGIQVEFNPDLALRKFGTQGRLEEECLPESLKPGKKYQFLKEGQRNYYLQGDVPLRVTEGNQNLSRPIASIRIENATHFLKEDKIYTRGEYLVVEIYHDLLIHFEGMEKII